MTLNALPKYQIRTMKNDLAGLGLKEPKKKIKPVKIKKPKLKIKKPELIAKLVKPKIELPKPEIPTPPKPEIISPAKPHLPSDLRRLKPTMVGEGRSPGKGRKFSIFSIILILFLVGVGIILYWQGTKPIFPSKPELKPEPFKSLESLIIIDETKIISLTTETSLFELLKKEAELDQPTETFKGIAILNPFVNKEKQALTLNEFFRELEISIPPYALAEIKENYALVLYNKDARKSLGLIAEVKNSENLKDQLKFWEETMVDDLKTFFLGQNPGAPAFPGFQDNIYRKIAIRYINFPKPDLTIDYAVTNNFFILTTSKKSMYKIIDKIVDNL